MSEPLISEREHALFKGGREIEQFGPFEILLYWEPHFENVAGEPHPVLKKSFTVEVDGGGILTDPRYARQRFARLTDADAFIEDIKDDLLITIGRIAFRIN